ncbi:hypothetical protein JR316_0012230 [Psilocybe cubensis]|uniref:Uncharacterized protein n=2 Tax=Psilocybe cubensis TaxID=181762 RepID=A0A8H7XR92_PSICU|nr:hypothetical protein JR316_0012230 [Psilocybe cubensis]KAH9475119.1 hypothetical protein JR316_0012230 [Psilocybe cubensis]
MPTLMPPTFPVLSAGPKQATPIPGNRRLPVQLEATFAIGSNPSSVTTAAGNDQFGPVTQAIDPFPPTAISQAANTFDTTVPSSSSRFAANTQDPLATSSTASNMAGTTAINPNQAQGHHMEPLKIILISVGVAIAAILGLLVFLLVYCRRRKRQRSEIENFTANPFTKSSPPPHLSSPPESFEAAQKYIDVLEGQIERMRREGASATITAQARAGPSTSSTHAFGELEGVEPPPQYESI